MKTRLGDSCGRQIFSVLSALLISHCFDTHHLFNINKHHNYQEQRIAPTSDIFYRLQAGLFFLFISFFAPRCSSERHCCCCFQDNVSCPIASLYIRVTKIPYVCKAYPLMRGYRCKKGKALTQIYSIPDADAALEAKNRHYNTLLKSM